MHVGPSFSVLDLRPDGNSEDPQEILNAMKVS